MSDQQQIIEQIVKMIIAAVKKGVLGWRRSWKSGDHANVISKERYGSINLLLLEFHAAEHRFTSKWWGTEDEWKRLHCAVKAEQLGCDIVVFLPVSEDVTHRETGTEYEYISWVLDLTTVFNANQVEGKAAKKFQAVKPAKNPPFDPNPL